MAETVGLADAEYALNLVRKICAEVGPGLPGTPQERQRAAIPQEGIGDASGRRERGR